MATLEYRIQQGDTPQKIAQAVYRDASLWPVIVDYNGLESPYFLSDDANFQREIPASGLVTFSRKSGISGTYPIPAGTEVATVTDAYGIQRKYKTQGLVTLASGANSVDTQVTCEFTGPEGNVPPGAVSVLLTSLQQSYPSTPTMMDFTGKVAGSTVENPHIARRAYWTSTLPATGSGAEEPQTGYNAIMAQDASNDGNVGTTSSGNYAGYIYSFDLLTALKQAGKIPDFWTATDLKSGLASITATWRGYGKGVAPYTNLLTANTSSAETDLTGWSTDAGVTVARTTAWAQNGSYSVEATGANSSTAKVMITTPTLSTGTIYMATAYIQNPGATAITASISIAGATAGTISVPAGGSARVPTTWTSTISTSATIRIWSSSTAAFRIDAVMLETGSTAHPWILGGTTSNVGGTVTYGATVKLWRSGAWVTWTSNTVSTPGTLTVGPASLNYTTDVDANGFFYILTQSTYAADGTNQAQVLTDYVKLDVTLNPITPHDYIGAVTNADDFSNGRSWALKLVGEAIIIPELDGTGEPLDTSLPEEDYLVLLGKKDLALGDSGELTSNNLVNADIASAIGLDNIAQAIRHRLATAKGELPMHPEFGSNLQAYIGTNLPFTEKLIELEIINTLQEDPRVASAEVTALTRSGPTLTADVLVVLVGRSEAEALQLSLNL